MKLHSLFVLPLLALVPIQAARAAQTTDGAPLASKIAAAKPGATVKLPAGRFHLGNISIPPGVHVIGAGYGTTILDATGFDNGLMLKGGKSAVSDLTVENASSAGIAVQGAADAGVSRVRVLGCGIGVILDGATTSRLENAIVAGNRTGIVMLRSAKSAIINCTASGNGNLSLSLGGNTDCAAFNNLLVGSQVGVFAAKDNRNLALDFNLYTALYCGGLTGEPARESLPAWRDASGYDRHSVELKVALADAKTNSDTSDFHPVTPLTWAPTRATSSDWGAKMLAGFAAPLLDMDGKKRVGETDLGAYEASFPAPRPADGKFTVQGGPGVTSSGITSAGLYSADGKQVALLFQNLPLAKGTYDFWLPGGLKLAPGSYEVRVAESDVHLRYIGLIGNGDAAGGVPNDKANSAAIDPVLVVFDRADHPILFQDGAEDHVQVHSFDTAFKLANWSVSGDAGARAAVVDDKDRLLYLNYVSGKAADGVNLYAVDAATGKGIPIQNGSYRKIITGVFSESITGMTALGESLFVADTTANKVYVGSTADLTFTKSFDVPAPSYPAADVKNKLVWVISGEKILALDPATGAVKYSAQPVARPVGLSVNNGRLAVGSAVTKRIHVFDCSDPANLKPLTALGREWKPGETGFGPLQPDRLIQMGPVALNSKGDAAIIAGNVRFFRADGSLARYHLSFWGQHTPSGLLTGPDGKVALHFSGMNSTHTASLNPATETWKSGFQLDRNSGSGELVCFFTEGGQNFAVYDPKTANADHSTFEIVRYEDGQAKAAVQYAFDDKRGAETMRTDSNNDGVIDDKDAAATLMNGPDGKPIAGLRFQQDGRLVAAGNIIPRTGLNAARVPVWDWSKYAPGKLGVNPAPGQGDFNGDVLPDGGWAYATNIGKVRGFGGGFNTIQAMDAAGNVRWTFPIDYHITTGGSRSVRVLPGVLTATATEELDTVFVSPDGLPMGVAGPGPDFHWEGFWHDQDWSIRTFTDGGKRYMVLGDYTHHGYHWMEIQGVDGVKRSVTPLVLDTPTTDRLAALPVPERIETPIPPTPSLVVRKLAAPLAVDGDLEKWRKLGIAPQILVSPPGIAPNDASALVRVAYEGDNLYFQVIKFDDVVTMHQPLQKHYKQDSTEFALFGGFMGGYKFSVTHTTDIGDILYREQFLMNKDLNLDPAKAPRVIKVLDNARDVEERKLIENSYGVDLSNSKVIITEFKIPVDYAWDGRPPMEMKSGNGFWLGLFIDDNDTPGLDDQRAYPWPATFAAFGNPDQGAWAVLE